MLGRYRKWTLPQGGVALLVDVAGLSRAAADPWRLLDRALASALLPLSIKPPTDDRIEVWGGLEGGGETLALLVAGFPLPSEILAAMFSALCRELPEGVVSYAGAAAARPELLPMYAATAGHVYRCAVSREGSAPSLQILVRGPEGVLLSAVTPSPVNIAAVVDKLPGVSVVVADMAGGAGAGYTEDGDRISDAPAPAGAAPGAGAQLPPALPPSAGRETRPSIPSARLAAADALRPPASAAEGAPLSDAAWSARGRAARRAEPRRAASRRSAGGRGARRAPARLASRG
jgi:hypothetical protein